MAFEQPGHRLGAADLGEVGGLGARALQPGDGHRLAVPLVPGHSDVRVLAPGDSRDPAAAGRGQVLGRDPGSATVIRVDVPGRLAVQRAPAQDHGQFEALGELVERVLAVQREEQRPSARRERSTRSRRSRPRSVSASRSMSTRSVFSSAALTPTMTCAKKGSANRFGSSCETAQQDGASLRGDQSPGHRVGHVSEFPHRLADRLAGGAAHVQGVVDHPGGHRTWTRGPASATSSSVGRRLACAPIGWSVLLPMTRRRVSRPSAANLGLRTTLALPE